VGGENQCRPRLFGEHCENITTRAFNGNLLCVETSPEQLSVEEIAHRALVAGDGLDVHELTGQGDDIHARQDTLVQSPKDLRLWPLGRAAMLKGTQ
jgi:hypothetical protein